MEASRFSLWILSLVVLSHYSTGQFGPETQHGLRNLQNAIFQNSKDNQKVNEFKTILESFALEQGYGSNALHGFMDKTFRNVSTTTLATLTKDVKSEKKNSTECYLDTMRILYSLKSPSDAKWAIPFIDAWGKPPPGILFGDFNWIGSYQQCIRLEAPGYKPLGMPGFKGQYFVSHFSFGAASAKLEESEDSEEQQPGAASSGTGIPGAVPGVSIGLCFPATCDPGVVWWMVNQSLGAVVKVDYVYAQPLERKPLTPRAKGVIFMLSVIGACLLAGTVYDVIFFRHKLRKTRQLREMTRNAEANGSTEDDVLILRAQENKSVNNDQLEADIRKEVDEDIGLVAKLLMSFSILNNTRRLFTVADSNSDSTLGAVHGIRFLSMAWVILGHTFVFFTYTATFSLVGKLLMAFSVYNNCRRLMTVAPAKGDNTNLEAVHGIRFLSMSYVILGHSFAFVLSYTKNIGIAGDLVKRWTFQTLLSATVSVDSFFVLSGVLVSFLVLREMKKKGGVLKLNWPMFYIHRYWRLTIPYMLVLGVNAALFEYIGHGPNWPPIDINANCNESWWTNLLYVNNLVKTDQACFGWAWYLANDMQFYWITPLFIIPLFLIWWVGIGVTSLTLFISLLVTGIISAQNKFLPMPVSIMHPEQDQAESFNKLYQAPWCRIGPYLIGVLLGYLLYVTNRRIKLHWSLVILGWVLAAGVNVAVIYGLYPYTKGSMEMSNSLAAFYNATHRTAWGASLCWVIFACVCGYGGIVNTLLSWSALVPLSRLTYMAYLCHPIVIFSYLLQMQYLWNYDDYSIIYLFFGHMVMSYSVAFVACLAFEAPFMALEKVIVTSVQTWWANRPGAQYMSVRSDNL